MIKSLLQYFYYLLGEGVSKGIIFLTFSVFTNYFSKEDFGRLALFWITIPFFSIFIDFAQRSYIKKRLLHSKKRAVESIFRAVISSTIITVIFLILKALTTTLQIYVVDETFDKYIIFCAYFYAIIEIVLSYFQIGGLIKQYNIYYALRNAAPYLFTITVILLLKQERIFEPVLFAQIQLIVFILIAVIALYKVSKIHAGIKIKSITSQLKKRIWISLKFSLPIVPGILSALFLSFADRFIINYYYSEIEVADYTVAYTISSIFMAFFLATNKMWQKFILENLKANNLIKLSRAARNYIGIVISVGAIIIILKSYLVLIMANKSYFVILDIIPTIILGMFFYFLYTVLSNIPFYHRNTFLMALPAIIAAILNLILNFILIPKFGYKVAAITTTISYFIEFVVIYILCLKKYKTDILFNGLTKRFLRTS
ncbi:MAG: polysaccharide biosynthesis C-terminal domain-containing protein [Saonia sp.]